MITTILFVLFLAMASAPWLGAERHAGSSDRSEPGGYWYAAAPSRR